MTSYEYEIQGDYGDGWELLTTEQTLSAARAQLSTYRANESIPLRIKRVRALDDVETISWSSSNPTGERGAD
jgi:hypothetical protein